MNESIDRVELTPLDDDIKKKGIDLFNSLPGSLKAMGIEGYDFPAPKTLTYESKIAEPIERKFKETGGRAIADIHIKFKTGETMVLHFKNVLPKENAPSDDLPSILKTRAFDRAYWDYMDNQPRIIKNKLMELENVESAEIRWH